MFSLSILIFILLAIHFAFCSEFSCLRPNEIFLNSSICQVTCENYEQKCFTTAKSPIQPCHCKPGYARDDTYTCIPNDQCKNRKEKICEKYEEYRYDVYYHNECQKQILRYYNSSYTYGCFCIKGFKRDVNGFCIPNNQCPNSCKDPEGSKYNCTNKPNEHYECGSACQTTCDNIGQKCDIINIKCNEGCYCNLGYARNASGDCVPYEECPGYSHKCFEKANEIFLCSTPSRDTCENFDDPYVPDEKCTEGCYCKFGYARDPSGVCVPYDKCPNICKKRPNEHYACGSACQTECTNLGRTCPIVNFRCNDRCYCDEGYARNASGICIPIQECPGSEYKCFEKPHEHYECGSACQTTCNNYLQECKIINIQCNKGCYCDDAYARNNSGVCVPYNECPGFEYGCYKKPNEIYACGSACQTTCENFGEKCDTINKKCVEGCYCEYGYARDLSGTCVPFDKCPNICKKRPNEVYGCGSACQTTCKNLGQKCPIINIKCNDDCYCIPGYARNATGICVPEQECPGYVDCSAFPNEHYQCGSACQPTCATQNEPCKTETKKCNNGCYCNPGFIRDDSGKCIDVQDCPKKS